MALQGPFWRFSDDGKEFIIIRRDLKQPWLNFLSTDHLNSVLTHTGIGASFGRSVWADWVQDDRSPRLVFVYDRKSQKHWTINGVESARQPKDWKCVHGFCYSTISSSTDGIDGSVTYMLPLDESAELWHIRLHNQSAQPRSLRIFPAAKFSLGVKNHEKMYDDVHFENNTILAEAYLWPTPGPRNSFPECNRNWDRIGFMTSDIKASGFDCDEAAFSGEGGSLLHNAVVPAGACRNSLTRGVSTCGVLQLDVALKPRETRELVVLVGMGKDRKDIRRITRKLGSVDKVRKTFLQVKQWWNEYLDRMHVDVPDKDIGTFTNGWNRYGMYIRYYHRYGYRDTAQDMSSFIAFDRDRFHARMKLLMEAVFKDGYAYHDVAQIGFPQHVSINSDPPAWLPWLVTSYVKESGDFGFLRKNFSFQDGSEGTAYDHIVRVLDYYRKESGRFGLPLIKCGDWNDCLMGSNAAGVSVWLAEFLYISLTDTAEMAQRMGKSRDAERFAEYARTLKKAINDRCWDGKWYVRALDDKGAPIGSRKNSQGKIFLNAQSWAVLSGIATPERAATAMRSVERIMDTPVGIPLVTPPYSKVEPRIGLLSRIVPGKHHQGVWNHANTWAIIAECMIGRPDRALVLYKRIFPPYLSQTWNLHHAEPYAFASYTNIPLSGETGRTGVGWNTGTVCWMYRALFEGFGGVRPEWDGLRIDPRLPAEWDWMRMKRWYRGNVFHIAITRNQQGAKGIQKVIIDGKASGSNLIAADPKRKERRIEVIVGK